MTINDNCPKKKCLYRLTFENKWCSPGHEGQQSPSLNTGVLQEGLGHEMRAHISWPP